MSAPKRLLEDPDTAQALRADLEAAQSHQVAYDLTQGLSRFETNLPNLGPGGSSLGGLKSAVVKLGIVGAVGGAALMAVTLFSEQLPDSGQQPTSLPAPASDRQAEQVPEVSRVSEATAPEATTPSPTASGEAHTTAPSAKPPRKAAAPQAAASASATSRDDLLAEEVEQLRKIRQVLPQNPGQALSWADRGHARFRGGVLYQEREALALQALNALGRRAELEQRGSRYLEAFPAGSFSNQVRHMLKR